MGVKLIKTDGTYILSVNEYKDEIFAIADTNKVHELNKHKLSLKNCEAIENGYDLDDLADVHGNIYAHSYNSETFKEGFQKALSILGDKKFSEKDMRRALSIGYGRQFEIENKQIEIDNYIQSLQQNEWDVEIEMENKQQLTNGYKNQPDNVIGFIAAYENVVVPKLDEDGCLILKRK